MFGIAEEDVAEEQSGVPKVLNFNILYGASDFDIARKLGVSVSSR